MAARASTTSTDAPESGAAGRWLSLAVVVLAIAVAAYTGFRLPSAWTATLDSVSLVDGFHRRFVVGTLLWPLASATDHDYWVLAGWSLAVLFALLAVLVTAVARAELASQRVLVIAWLLLPTGGYAFHEVGYFDQVLYLLVFAAVALVARQRLVIATALMCIAPFVHEIAIATVIPVFGLVALRTLPLGRALAVTALPASLNALVLAIPGAADGAPTRLATRLAHANFPMRDDAIALFDHTVTESWRMHRAARMFADLRPALIVVVAAFVLLWLLDRTMRRAGPSRVPGFVLLVASCVAIAAPSALVLGGFDGSRWQFLLTCNFFLVLWLVLGDRGGRELSSTALATLVVALLLLSHFSFVYFDDLAPRDLGSLPQRRTFLRQLRGTDPSLFAIPKV